MRLLALDLATRSTGWCAGDTSSIPTCGNITIPDCGVDLGRLGILFRDGVSKLIADHQPGACVYESPILRKTDKLAYIRKTYGLGMVLETLCADHKIPCHEIDLRTIKRELTGDSFAPKSAMVKTARRCGITLPGGSYEGRVLAEDAADAFGAFVVGVRHYDKGASAHWDRAIYGQRGGLL